MKKLSVIDVKEIVDLLISKKLMHEGEMICGIRMDGLGTIIIERVSSEKKDLLESPIGKDNFSVRLNQALRGNPKIKTIRDLISTPMEDLVKLSGFKEKCVNELYFFREKNGL